MLCLFLVSPPLLRATELDSNSNCRAHVKRQNKSICKTADNFLSENPWMHVGDTLAWLPSVPGGGCAQRETVNVTQIRLETCKYSTGFSLSVELLLRLFQTVMTQDRRKS